MLSVSRLKRAYGDFVAADAVSFSITKGEIVGLLGHNGAGKTTVMKMLSGFLEPSAGQIMFDGEPLFDNLKKLQSKIGYLPENLPVYPEMSVAAYLEYAARLKGIAEQQMGAEIKRVVQATDIAAKLLAPIATLSRGYKQRVGVAQALLGKPRLLILDEPTNGLDPQQTLQMRALIRTIAQEATVILSTHIMQEVEALCDRVLLMRAGQLVLDKRLEDLRQAQSILLKTSLPFSQLEPLMSALPGVLQLHQLPAEEGLSCVRLALQQDQHLDLNKLCASAASAIVNSQAALYQLQPEVRDLETLFRDINNHSIHQPEALGHAA